MTQPNGAERFYFTPEHFRDPTPATRDELELAFEQLQEAFADRTTMRRNDYINCFVGNTNGHYARILCSLDEWHDPQNDTTTTNNSLLVTIATNLDGPVPKRRSFSYGRASGDMTDDEYANATAHLTQTLPTTEWGWIEKARLMASTAHDESFLPFQITELLETAPPQTPICSGKEYLLGPLDFNNGTRLEATWIEANSAYVQQLDPRETTRLITLQLPTGEKYIYLAFTDGTEQMLVETEDASVCAKLISQGIAVLDTSDGVGAAMISPEQRRKGIQAPSNALMRRFDSLIRSALESGVSNLGST